MQHTDGVTDKTSCNTDGVADNTSCKIQMV